jgi:hypothetical protein
MKPVVWSLRKDFESDTLNSGGRAKGYSGARGVSSA